MSTQWRAKVTGMTDVAPELAEAVREGTQGGLSALGTEGAKMVQQNIATPYDGKPAAVNTGHLEASITSSFQEVPGLLREIIGVGPELQADRYAAPVETGARPHMPPPSSLLPWVKKKFGIDNDKDALSVAFAVSRNIAKRGTSGHLMFDRAFTELQPRIVPALEAQINASLARHGFTAVAS